MKKIKLFFNSLLTIDFLLLIYLIIKYNINEVFSKSLVEQWSFWIFIFLIPITIITKKVLNIYKKQGEI